MHVHVLLKTRQAGLSFSLVAVAKLFKGLQSSGASTENQIARIP